MQEILIVVTVVLVGLRALARHPLSCRLPSADGPRPTFATLKQIRVVALGGAIASVIPPITTRSHS